MAVNNEYGQLFCEAVDLIVEQRLKDIQYDSTILCTVIDDNDKDAGIYRVKTSDGTAAFLAYSEKTDYSNGDNVYVQIPNGDMNEQKFIIAKKTDKTNIPLSYKPPFASFINITGNLVSNTNGVKAGLIANEQNSELNNNAEAITIWGYNIEHSKSEIGEPLNAYTRLGIQAQFCSWLDGLKVRAGDYGLRLRLQVEKVDSTDFDNADDDEVNQYFNFELATEYNKDETYFILQDEKYKRVKELSKEEFEENDYYIRISIPFNYYVELNTEDMIGDPYNYDTYYQQEKVFSIEEFYSITQMELQFYQNKNFYNENNELIAVLDNPNLFVKDVNISLGYDVDSFNGDEVRIFSFDSLKYDTNADPQYLNHKRLEVRWIHKFEDGTIRVVTEEDNLDYEITWYKYRLGSYSHTPISGADWKPLSNQYSDTRIKRIANENITEDPPNKFNILDQEWLEYNQSAEPGQYYLPNLNKTWLVPDITLASESIKAILTYYPATGVEQSYISNRLDFSNREEVVSKPTVDAVTALSIFCEDESNGNYMIYNQGNELIDSAQGSTEKKFTAYFKGAPLENAEYIEWIIPSKNSMIKIDDSFLGAIIPSEIENKKEFSEINNNAVDEAGRYHIYRFGRSDDKYNITHANTQKYKIKSYYTPEYNDNTIQCKVVKDKITYTATKTLTFGPSGTSGADHTLIIDFDEENVNAIDIADPAKRYYNIIARLYDYSGKEIDFASADCSIEWNWYYPRQNSEKHLEIAGYYEEEKVENSDKTIIAEQKLDKYKNKISLRRVVRQVETEDTETEVEVEETLDINELYILQAKLTWRGKQNLIAYFPVPLRKYQPSFIENIYDENKQIVGEQEVKEEYGYISGATQIIYQADGLPYYNKTPYNIYKTKFIHKVEDNTTASSQVKGQWRQDLTLAGPIDKVSWSILKTDDAEKVEKFYPTIDEKTCLSPIPLYIEDAPFCGVQAMLNEEVIWTQPILIIMNRYPNGAINRWDGHGLVIDEENGSIIGTAFAAGKKNNDDNTFSGVMLGDWKQSAQGDVEDSIGSMTGVYGLYHGAVSYALKEDGSMFIGQSGEGRIYFDGKDGKIYSGNYYLDENSKTIPTNPDDREGMLIDLSKGHIDAYNFSLTSRTLTIDSGISYDADGKIQYSGSKFEFELDEGKNSYFVIGTESKDLLEISNSKFLLQDVEGNMSIDLSDGYIKANKFLLEAGTDDQIIIDSEADKKSGFPFKVGDYFKIAWDGSLYAENAFLQGTLNVGSGIIGGWLITENMLEGGAQYETYYDENEGKYKAQLSSGTPTIQLNSGDGSIAGGIIKPLNSNSTKLYGDLQVYKYNADTNTGTLIGTSNRIGYVESALPGVEDEAKPGIGIEVGTAKLKVTEANVGMSHTAGFLSLGSTYAQLGYNTGGTVVLGKTNGYAIRVSATGGIVVHGTSIDFKDIAANNQTGIYARFAPDSSSSSGSGSSSGGSSDSSKEEDNE